MYRLLIDFAHLEPDGQYHYSPSAEMQAWCKEHLQEPVMFSETRMPLRYYATLSNTEDAIHFKMRWC